MLLARPPEADDPPTQPVNTDSLLLSADSLARAADSLKSLVNSLLRPPAKPASGLPAGTKPATAANEAPAEPWEGSFGLGLTVNRGNSSQQSFVSTLDLNRKGEKARFNSNSSVTSTNSSDGGRSQKGSFKNKFERDQNRRFFYFVALDLDYNRQAGIDLRMAPGLGVGISAINRRKCSLHFNLGANPVTEYLRYQPRRTKGHYLAGEDLRWTFNSRTRLEQSVVWKPRFDKTQDYLLNFNASLTNKLTGNFDLKLNLEGRYNSRPPLHDPPIRRQDWMFYTAIAYSLW
ncbi:MAG: hypothetical protein A3F83_09695 [Candidatus Glassbacteria bacterium RIFCSPLOWO2_12_FULL_58_11]|uniref:DUF481 domain-containing protein n=1 Tax=Candidatus Glassbacteria bacterium RIFCSPLOWO2_12_FULL_58_11 TaxID=1817867 RepID=A0A1F5YK20_9BACT|nr:MAG: hypothetical protein A3F83_09695 [Candidatus Glassbacteria bacterium RIFCSPLOWO2_12_FULL_58_11]